MAARLARIAPQTEHRNFLMGIANKEFGRNDALLILYDDYVEFQANCAFLCNAVASMAGQEDRFDTGTAMGIKQFCQFVKERSEELWLELGKLQNIA